MSFGKRRHCRRPRRSDLGCGGKSEGKKVTEFFVNCGRAWVSGWESGCPESLGFEKRQCRNTSRQACMQPGSHRRHKHIFSSLLCHPQNVKLPQPRRRFAHGSTADRHSEVKSGQMFENTTKENVRFCKQSTCSANIWATVQIQTG